MTPHDSIRALFLLPQQTYFLDEARHLLAYSEEELMGAVADGDLALDPSSAIPRLPWEELAHAAVERWSQEVIEAALGDDLGSVMPELARLTDLHVRVPRYSVAVLGRIAQREGTSVSEIVTRELLELATIESEELERSMRGLGAAIRWPLR